jgi:nucleotide-binding universal stress UspA family protein
MYRSLIVPLDQSTLAEQALPMALSVARRANAALNLIKVHAQYGLENSHGGWAPYQPERDTERWQAEQLYLDATAKFAAALSPVSITANVLAGSAVLPTTVADSIMDRVRISNADLIVMTTHGRGPLSRFGLGSVADELIRRAPIPILLVRPAEKSPELLPEPVLDSVLIPLDGSDLAERILGPAVDLAKLMEARCTLLRVVEPNQSLSDRSPGGNSEMDQAKAYLERIAAGIREQGLVVQTRVVGDRPVAEAVLEEAAAQGSNLIALATHGRGGLKRLLLGSLAARLVRAAAAPVLVFHPGGNGVS